MDTFANARGLPGDECDCLDVYGLVPETSVAFRPLVIPAVFRIGVDLRQELPEMFGINQWEMLVVLFVALLLFGKRLPEVARSMGKGITEFKKGMRGFEDELRDEPRSSTPAPRRPAVGSDEQMVSAPKFEPPKSAPVETAESSQNI